MTRVALLGGLLALVLAAAGGCQRRLLAPGDGGPPLGATPPVPADAAPPAPAPGGARLRLERLVVGWGKANCYVVWAEGSATAMVIDPGAEAQRIHGALRRRELQLAKIVHTHRHPDHIGGSRDLQAITGAPIYRHPLQGEVPLPRLRPGLRAGPVRDLKDGDVVTVGPLRFAVILTPGHSPGGICLLGHGVLFSGDLLFKGSAGRTDLPGGSAAELRRSLHERIAHVPDATRVLPGHGEASTMGYERRTNRFLRSR